MGRTQVGRGELVASPEILPRLVSTGAIVESYAEILRLGPLDGTGMGYPVVFDDGETKWVADGFKRLSAMDIIGIARPLVDLRKGSKADAAWFAAGANREHGQPMSKADKRRAVDILLRCEGTAELSSHKIAAQVGVGHDLVLARQARLDPKITQSPNGFDANDKLGETEEITQSSRGVNATVKQEKIGKAGNTPSHRFAPKRRIVKKGTRAKGKKKESVEPEPVILAGPVERRADLVARLTGLLDELGDWVDRVVRTGTLSPVECDRVRRGLDAMRAPVRDALRRAEEDLDSFTKSLPAAEAADA